jgi:hypothetical protein
MMDWRQFRDTADRLANASAEGDWRSAVSRAYYAVFHFFREWFRGQGVDLGKAGQSHANLYLGLLNCGVAAVGPLGSRVDDLREERVAADYDFQKPVRQPGAPAAVQQADRIIGDFQTALAAVSGSAVAAGARNYLQKVGRLPP